MDSLFSQYVDGFEVRVNCGSDTCIHFKLKQISDYPFLINDFSLPNLHGTLINIIIIIRRVTKSPVEFLNILIFGEIQLK